MRAALVTTGFILLATLATAAPPEYVEGSLPGAGWFLYRVDANGNLRLNWTVTEGSLLVGEARWYTMAGDHLDTFTTSTTETSTFVTVETEAPDGHVVLYDQELEFFSPIEGGQQDTTYLDVVGSYYVLVFVTGPVRAWEWEMAKVSGSATFTFLGSAVSGWYSVGHAHESGTSLAITGFGVGARASHEAVETLDVQGILLGTIHSEIGEDVTLTGPDASMSCSCSLVNITDPNALTAGEYRIQRDGANAGTAYPHYVLVDVILPDRPFN